MRSMSSAVWISWIVAPRRRKRRLARKQYAQQRRRGRASPAGRRRGSPTYDATVGVDWRWWEPFGHAVGEQLHEVERGVAQRYFDALMAARPERRQQLEALLEGNGVTISTLDEGLQALDDWYAEQVRPAPDDPSRLSPRWYALGLDIGLYLGEAIIERAPDIEWRLFTSGRKDASYQRPVLMGFGRVSNSKYNVDPERLVGIHGHRLVARLDEPRDLFVQIVRSASAKA
jgi:hypothetical protein